jgi:hypothetical protein
MHVLRLAAMILAITGGSLAFPNGPAAAAPLGAGALLLARDAGGSLLEKAGWRHRHFHHRHHGFYRRHWRPHRHYGFYRPYRYRPVHGIGWGYRPVVWGGPRLVCRWRPGPWGPRQVCWRRW